MREMSEDAQQTNCRLSLAFVYTDRLGAVHMRNVGTVHATKRGKDDDKILKTLRFQTGDFLDVAILSG